jgi:hypothetical protein
VAITFRPAGLDSLGSLPGSGRERGLTRFRVRKGDCQPSAPFPLTLRRLIKSPKTEEESDSGF